MAVAKRLSHPPVAKDLKPIVAHLRDVDGCTFEVRGRRIIVVGPTGATAGELTSRGGKRGGNQHPQQVVAQLRTHGLLATYGQEPARHPVAEPRRTDAPVRPRNTPPPPVSPVPPRLAVVPKPVAVPPKTGAVVPKTEPAPPAAAPAAAAPVDEEVPMTPAPAPAGPVRPHTAHQHREDQVRARVLRALVELGGNTTEVRRAFIVHAIDVAQQHGLALPIEGKLGGKSTAFESLRSSLGKYLTGGGQTQRNLDIWQAAVMDLEMPQGQAGQAEAEPVAAVAGLGVEPFADGVGTSGLPGSRPLYTSPRPPGYQAERLAAVEHEDDMRTAQADEGLARLDAAIEERVRAAQPDPLAELRASYLAQLAQLAADGDQDARDRVERYLQLG